MSGPADSTPKGAGGRRSPSISVVIPTHGRRTALLHESMSVLLADPATGEVIVVNDADDAATVTGLSALGNGDPRVRVLYRTAIADVQGPLVGRGQESRDAGARAAVFDLVLALDDDVRPQSGLVSGHAACHEMSQVGLVLGYMPVSWPPPTGASRAAARLYSTAYERACDAFNLDPDAVLRSMWGGNFSLRRADWMRALELPAVAAGYHVDRDFGLRLKALGVRGIFDRRLRADHLYARTVPELAEDAFSSGAGMEYLRLAHPEVRDSSPAAPAPILRVAAWGDPLAVVIQHIAARGARISGALGGCWLEYFWVRVLWYLARERGRTWATIGSRSSGSKLPP